MVTKNLRDAKTDQEVDVKMATVDREAARDSRDATAGTWRTTMATRTISRARVTARREASSSQGRKLAATWTPSQSFEENLEVLKED